MVYGINNITSANLINTFFGSTSGTSSASSMFGSKSTSGILNGTSSLSSLLGSLKTFQQNQQTFNRTELNLRNAAATAAGATFTSSVSSSNTAALSATSNGTAKKGDYKVDVTQLAKGQTVKTDNAVNLQAAGASAIGTGWSQIEMDVNGKKTAVSFQTQAGDTNQQAMGKMAAAINARNTGVTASVAVDAGGNARLSMTGQTGTANSFKVSDVVGNAAATAGVAVTNPATATNVTQQTQNASFSVKGPSDTTATNYTSASNTNAAVGTTGLSLNLKSVFAGTTVTVASDSANLESGVRKFVAQFNQTLTDLKSNNTGFAKQSATQLSMLATVNTAALKQIGITVNSGGTLQVNEATFSQAIKTNPEKVAGTMSGPFGFATMVKNATEGSLNTSFATPTTGGFSYNSLLNSSLNSNLGLLFTSLG